MSIFQIQAKDSLVRLNNLEALNCVQDFSWDGSLNEEKLSQLGDVNYDAQSIMPEVSAQFQVRSTGSLSAFLSRMLIRRNSTTGEFEGYQATSATDNNDLITETTLENAVFDLIESKKANEIFDRSTLITRAHLTSFSVNASADGMAMESFNVVGDVLEVFRAPMHDLSSFPATPVVATPRLAVQAPTGITVDEVGTVDPLADWRLYAVDVDGDRYTPADVEISNTGGRATITLTAGAQAQGKRFPLGAKVSIIAYRKTPGAFPTIVYPTSARFVKADKINIYLISPTQTFLVGGQTRTVNAHLAAGVDFNDIPFNDTDLFLRVQSIDMSVDLRREALRQIRKVERNTSTYYRSVTYPLDVTASITAMERDLSEWAKIQGKTATDVLDLDAFENQEWQIIVRYYLGSQILQTMGFLNARVSAPGSRVSVGGRSEVTWSFTGSAFAVQGRNI